MQEISKCLAEKGRGQTKKECNREVAHSDQDAFQQRG